VGQAVPVNWPSILADAAAFTDGKNAHREPIPRKVGVHSITNWFWTRQPTFQKRRLPGLIGKTASHECATALSGWGQQAQNPQGLSFNGGNAV